jgi:uncharacterized membrane protein
MEFHNEIIIERPIEEVFPFLSNLENIPKWNYYVPEVRKTSEGPVAKGTVFHQTRKSDQQDFKITEFESPFKLSMESLPPERYIVRHFHLTKENNFTKLNDDWFVKVPWIAAVFFQKRMQSAVKENLEKLKTLLEEGEVVLQDGRRMTR